MMDAAGKLAKPCYVTPFVASCLADSLILRRTVLSDTFVRPIIWRIRVPETFWFLVDAWTIIVSSSDEVFLFLPDPGCRPKWPFLSWFLQMRHIWCRLRFIISPISFIEVPWLLASMISACCSRSSWGGRGFFVRITAACTAWTTGLSALCAMTHNLAFSWLKLAPIIDWSFSRLGNP